MYKKILLVTGILTIALLVVANVVKTRADVVIFSTMEDYRLDQLSKDLKKKFPNKSIAIQYMSTGELVSRLKTDDINTNCDIIMGLEATNAEILLKEKPDILYNLNDAFKDEYAPENIYDADVLSKIPETSYKPGEIVKYHIMDKEAGCIIVNTKVLEEKKLEAPESFEELLDPKYKGLICMPDPVYSGTGYYWFNGLVSTWGEDNAIEYFEALDDNFINNGYTTSGSGPLKYLESKQAGIGLGMSFQVAKYLHDNQSIDHGIDMLYFDITGSDGTKYESSSPYTLYTMGVVNTKWGKEGVEDVYRYIYNEWNMIDKYMFDPETIYKSQNTKEFKDLVTQYFGDYKFAKSYMPMQNIFDPDYKVKLLDDWSKWRNEKYGK